MALARRYVSEYSFGDNQVMASEYKYARVEWERRFLLARFPAEAKVTQVRRIVDRYIDGTTLRLRQMREDDGRQVFKLTQKLAAQMRGARQGLITNIYLASEEFDVLSQLPARMLRKTRHSVPPFGIDVFEGELRGLVLAEAEFHSAEEAAALEVPPFLHREVTTDVRFSGGKLATATRDELRQWLAEYGLTPG